MILEGTLVLGRSEIVGLIPFEEYVQAVERAFRMHGLGIEMQQGLLHLDAKGGEFHIKAGGLPLDRFFCAVKVNGGFYSNSSRHGLPNILGTISLCDGTTGYPLALLESGWITRQRTAASAAVAAKYLARPESEILTLCGCGSLARGCLQGMKDTLPIRKCFVYGRSPEKVRKFAEQMSEELKMEVEPSGSLSEAVRRCDVCITCTPSHAWYLRASDVSPGTFIAGMGADSPQKQELEPALLALSKVVVDLVEQAAEVGELHHGLAAGAMRREDVYAELGEIVAGKKPGRTSEEEIVVFDSTGTAMQDVAAAAAVYEKALVLKVGRSFNLLQ